MIEYSPEKDGVGGSTPSLATTIFNQLPVSRFPIIDLLDRRSS